MTKLGNMVSLRLKGSISKVFLFFTSFHKNLTARQQVEIIFVLNGRTSAGTFPAAWLDDGPGISRRPGEKA